MFQVHQATPNILVEKKMVEWKRSYLKFAHANQPLIRKDEWELIDGSLPLDRVAQCDILVQESASIMYKFVL